MKENLSKTTSRWTVNEDEVWCWQGAANDGGLRFEVQQEIPTGYGTRYRPAVFYKTPEDYDNFLRNLEARIREPYEEPKPVRLLRAEDPAYVTASYAGSRG